MFSLIGTDTGLLDVPETSSEQSPLCCRACLSTDGRLFNIHEYKLTDDFSRIAGTPELKDKLPQHLCSFCRSLLLKCASFKAMCARTQQLLMPEILKGQPNIDSIRRINQHHNILNLTITEVKTISIIDSAQDNDEKVTETLSQEFSVIETLPIEKIEDIKHEPITEIIDINRILTESDDTDDIIQEPDDIMKLETKLDEFKGENTKITLVKDKNAIKKRKTKIQTTKKKREAKNEINIKKETDEVNNEHVDVSRQIGNRSVKKRNVYKEQNETNAAKRRNKTNIGRKIKKRERNEWGDITYNKMFESDYSVKIVVLNKEDQLAEIAARKETRNYLESNFKCEECYKGFDSEAAFNNHKLRHSHNAGSFVCEVCHTRFAKNYMKTYHQKRHRVKILCTKCNFVSRTKSQATQHHAVHEGRTYDCEHCGKSFLKRSSHLSHVRLAHPERNVACGECGEVFVGNNGLKMHQAKMHSEKHKCTTCSAKFVSVAALNRHTDTANIEHSELRPCEQCGENCASEEALREHVRETHRTTRRCEECNMAFPSSEAYSTHVSRTHLQQRKREAHRSAGRKPALPGAHMCEQCGRILPSSSYLKIHQRSHQGLKPFSCNECSKSFTTKEYLVIHLRSHSGVKPFQCPSCPLAFTQKGNYLRHHKTAHLGVRESFACPYCGSTATTKSSLRVHIDSKHGGKGWPKSRKRAKNPKTL